MTSGVRRISNTPDIFALLAGIPESLRPAVQRCLESCELPQQVERRGIVRLLGSSEFAAAVLQRECDRAPESLAPLLQAFDVDALTTFGNRLAESDLSHEGVQRALRQERQRQLLGILYRDVTEVVSTQQSLRDLSTTADILIEAATRCATRLLAERYGELRNSDGTVVPMLVIAMGKLGGRELNFSSDVDLVFAYSDDGLSESDGRRSLPAQPYMDRLSRLIVTLLDEVTADGFVYRVDTRLRPFGESGPPVTSFRALESYLLQHGRDWERYAYIKARLIGRHDSDAVVNEFLHELVRPFVYRRYLDFGVFESLRDMHQLIASEVQRRELTTNVKLGPGGIREIEFIVQSLQLVRGGRERELRSTALLDALSALAANQHLPPPVAAELQTAYLFLRRLENCIQGLRDQQQHDIPESHDDRARLTLAMGAADFGEIERLTASHRRVVSEHFDRIAFRETEDRDAATTTAHFEDLWKRDADVDDWIAALADLVKEPTEIARRLVDFRRSGMVTRIDQQAHTRLQTFVPQLLQLVSQCGHPELAFSRVLSVTEQILRRSAYIALLNENRLAAERLVNLCERSAYIARQLSKYPALLDELLQPEQLHAALSRDELLTNLHRRLKRDRPKDSEQHMETLVQFQRANLFRVAVADFAGTLPLMKVSDSLTFLAETVLQHALDVAWSELADRHGVPGYKVAGQFEPAGFAIVAYGKLGGLELSYGSDLDIIFLHNSKGEAQQTNGDKPLENAVFFSRLVRRLTHFLTTQTSSGELYEVDTRLRPSGRKGLLVTSVDAFLRYQFESAWTWEHQALLRARCVAGSAEVCAAFDEVRAKVLRHRGLHEDLEKDVLAMRAKMRKELDKSDSSRFDLKHGQGGIGDIEFIVQYLVLREAAQHPSVTDYSDNIRQLDALAGCDVISPGVAAQLQDIYRHYRTLGHHRALNDQATDVPAGWLLDERAAVSAIWQKVFET